MGRKIKPVGLCAILLMTAGGNRSAGMLRKSDFGQSPGDKPNVAISAGERRFGAIHNGITAGSEYVAMRDGVKIAVDVLLPKGLPAGEKLPTLLDLTRYWRQRPGQPPSITNQ